MSPADVSGADVRFSWSATGGATDYRLEAGTVPGVYLGGLNTGNVTTYAVVAPAVGTFFVRVIAITPNGNLASAAIAVTVTTLIAPPAVPANLSVARNGTGILASWSAGVGGGAPLAYRLTAALTPGGAGATLNLGTNSFAAAPVPAGTYYFRVAALNAGGASADSSEFQVNMPAGGACDPPPQPVLSQIVFGGYINVSWAAVPGAAGYVLTGYQGSTALGSLPVGASFTRFSHILPAGTWRLDVAAVFSCGSQGAPAAANIVIDDSTLRMQPRAPNPNGPTPPNYIRLPNRVAIVEQVAAQYFGELRASCGNHRFLFRVLNRLRQEDKRWGLNWKRSIFGSMSEDVLNYNFGSEPDEGTRQTHVVDIISGHCGPNPGPAWIDQTVLFTTGATWTLLPYIQAGYIP